MISADRRAPEALRRRPDGTSNHDGSGSTSPTVGRRRPCAGAPTGHLMVGGRDFLSKVRRLYLPLLAFLVLMLFPFYWMFITSIKPNRELYSQKVMPLVVHQPTLQHYVDLFDQTNFLTWTYNTMLVAIVTTVIPLVLGAMIGYPLAPMN